ncbi:hypothetical protein SDC9_127231 [bioreactor metagenome]|uniref:Uncharacterized protein n=1 Tax=bioreactor metagenome TaxID=1076179 RepID=A0A645CTF3_9ZZZZ
MKMLSTNEINSPINHFDYMKAAVEMELATKVLYLNSEEVILIIDFIESRGFPISKAKSL